MSHISRRTLDSKTRRKILDALELVLGKCNKTEANSFLFSLLSDTERLMLAKRLAIALLLKEGIDHSSIADALSVTRETVYRIELSFLKRSSGFELAFQKIDQDEKLSEAKKFLIAIASYSIKASGGRVDIKF